MSFNPQYKASPDTLLEGQRTTGTVDSSGALRVSGTVASGGVVDDEGTTIDVDSMSHVLGYTAGNLTTDTVTDGVDTWVQTFTYTDGVVTAISEWVKQ